MNNIIARKVNITFTNDRRTCCSIYSIYTQNDCFSLKGLCNKRCLGGRCHSHRNRKPLKPCKNNCGNGKKIQKRFPCKQKYLWLVPNYRAK